ncbi:MAG: hypothetical protein OXC92_00940 [Flavobacteriaceae bacterium]|nr:hypothetical protein [Flavobacteriaceae bacterium]
MESSKHQQLLTAIESVKIHTTKEVTSVKDNNKEVLKSIRNLEDKVKGMDKRIDKNTYRIKFYKKAGGTVFTIFLGLFAFLFNKLFEFFK